MWIQQNIIQRILDQMKIKSDLNDYSSNRHLLDPSFAFATNCHIRFQVDKLSNRFFNNSVHLTNIVFWTISHYWFWWIVKSTNCLFNELLFQRNVIFDVDESSSWQVVFSMKCHLSFWRIWTSGFDERSWNRGNQGQVQATISFRVSVGTVLFTGWLVHNRLKVHNDKGETGVTDT